MMEKGEVMKRKLLIANRGEIACRIVRSCRELGLQTVAVYSEADRDALHVQEADEAVAIGPADARASYLNIDAILNAARQCGAHAIHPGYGFLAENADFARAVIDMGLVWVGPTPETLVAMGDKEQARQIAAAAGVPIVPGTGGFGRDQFEHICVAAKELGFPLLVKAAAGGGGIGMRCCHNFAELEAAVEATQSMAAKAFGDATVYLERCVVSARHLEVQVFGFGDGSGVHLFDRDCSIQRRFQKIVEEAPAPNVPQHIRDELYRSSMSLVKAQNYEGAGTVEFIYDIDRDSVYFLEMNTRIQVEHPATEAITGVDLVEWQIKQALGQLEPVTQSSVAASGHAIECRIYAERPERGFLPSPGTITGLAWPAQKDWLRIDTGFRAGDRVTVYYDPMVAKLIVLGDNREMAISQMQEALEEMSLSGISHNIQFLYEILSDVEFAEACMTTNFVNEYLARRKSEHLKAG